MSIRAVIVDDEELARKRLRRLLQKYEDRIEVVGEAQSGEEAIERIPGLRPDVLFLDIQMPGLSGFDVVRRLECKPFIVFATAYNEFALKAFEENSVDYLLKPVEQIRLDKTIDKLERMVGDRDSILRRTSSGPSHCSPHPRFNGSWSSWEIRLYRSTSGMSCISKPKTSSHSFTLLKRNT